MKTIKSDNQYLRWIHKTGTALVAVSVLVLLLTFLPVIKEEVKYQLWPQHKDVIVMTREMAQKELEKNTAQSQAANDVIYPTDENFGIVVPKIGANTSVVPDVDWRDAFVYQRALTKGVAHAVGTAHPGEAGNIFIFSHSGVDFYEANRYNAQFYLLTKLVAGDEVYLFYKKQKFVYRVVEQKIVSPESVEYITGDTTKKTLTLMTCWPAGTTIRRLIVVANQVENN